MFKKLLISLVLVVPFVFGSVGITSAHATSGGGGSTTIIQYNVTQQLIPAQSCRTALIFALAARRNTAGSDQAVLDYVQCRENASSFLNRIEAFFDNNTTFADQLFIDFNQNDFNQNELGCVLDPRCSDRGFGNSDIGGLCIDANGATSITGFEDGRTVPCDSNDPICVSPTDNNNGDCNVPFRR